MNDLRKPLNRGGFARPPEDIDALLRQFFRAEMPEPWPAAPAVPVAAPMPLKPQRRAGFRAWGRFALAAAVALFLIGYLTLAGRFPAGAESRLAPVGPKMSKGLDHHPVLPPRSKLEMLRPQRVPLRGGGEAEIRGVREQGPRRTIHLHVERIR